MPRFLIELRQEVTRWDYATLEIEAEDKEDAEKKINQMLDDDELPDLDWESGEESWDALETNEIWEKSEE